MKSGTPVLAFASASEMRWSGELVLGSEASTRHGPMYLADRCIRSSWARSPQTWWLYVSEEVE
eukprot:5436292-Pyramimonas_sp.AAC.1